MVQNDPYKILRYLAFGLIIIGGGLTTFILGIIIYQKIIFAIQDWDYKVYRLKEMASLEYTVASLLETERTIDNTPQIQSEQMAGPEIITTNPSPQDTQLAQSTQPTTSTETLSSPASYTTQEPTTIKPTSSSSISKKTSPTTSTSKKTSSSKTSSSQQYSTYFLIIPSIGVKTEILRKGTVKKRMIKGVAIYNDYGLPDKNNHLPIILASHRFGYAWWTPSYRRTHSFHNFDKLKIGDKVYIKWKSKWYTYKVTKKYVAKKFKNYNVDMIMYTCVDYLNPNRIIVEAKRI